MNSFRDTIKHINAQVIRVSREEIESNGFRSRSYGDKQKEDFEELSRLQSTAWVLNP